jgi:putative flippase GtrA/GT2 family glycosyltransferase
MNRKQSRSEFSDDFTPNGLPASQVETKQLLRSMAASQRVAQLQEAAYNGRSLALAENPEAAIGAMEPASAEQARVQKEAARAAKRGRHAAPPPPYLERRAARFTLFCAIGGFVFLMGLGLQAVLTGRWHVLPMVSYVIQAVVSVETSFLLNRWLTWRDRNIPFWLAFFRFNAQKTVTITLNLALYAGMLRLGMNYLVANIVLTGVFTVVNYVAGDRLVFIPGRRRPAEPDAPAVPVLIKERPKQTISVVIPCRGNESTIRATLESLLRQDYPCLGEIFLIGSPGDSTWRALGKISDPRLSVWETETPPGMRDANFKRDAAIRMTSCDLVALVDSDIVLPPDWMSRAVATLEDSGASCVAGGMKSSHDTFWGRYTDSTWIGAKTPRIAESYTVTSADFGVRGRKPPISANVLFTRGLYDNCPIDPFWSHGSYEDYEWFWRVAKAGYAIHVCRDLFGWHHHRRGMSALIKEYRRSSRGCAYFVLAHMDSPFAQRRLRQAIVLPLTAAIGLGGTVVAVAYGYGSIVAGGMLGCAAMLAVHQLVRSRSLESILYPVVGLTLGLVFTTGLVTNLIRSGPRAAIFPITAPSADRSQAEESASRSRRRLLHPVMAICAMQAALSLTFVWSNTAYTDEATCLWIGRLETAHWMHGTSWPSTYVYGHLSGSPLIYPPIGALASNLDGLAGARILSLAFMLLTTVLLYLTASKLIGRTGALFASALWALSEPAMRLAFATPEPLSVLLTAFSSWLIVQASYRRHRGELIAAAAVTLALADVTAYQGLVIIPMVVAFAILAWLYRMRLRQPLSCAAWLVAAWAVAFVLLMTFSHSWPGLFSTVFGSNIAGDQSISASLIQIWGYSAIIIALALIGALLTLQSKHRNHAALLAGLAFAIFMIAQLHNRVVSSADVRLSYVVWFAAISAGYACSTFIHWLPGARRSLAMLCCAAALAYPAIVSWQSAWQRYHAWPNANAFINDIRPVAAKSKGSIYLPALQAAIAKYYTRQGYEWGRWTATLPLNPPGTPKSWSSYYSSQLHQRDYGIIVLFYSTTFSSVKLPGNILLSSYDTRAYQKLLSVVGANSGQQGLAALTLVLEKDKRYRLTAVGRYDTDNISGTHNYGLFAMWYDKELT